MSHRGGLPLQSFSPPRVFFDLPFLTLSLLSPIPVAFLLFSKDAPRLLRDVILYERNFPMKKIIFYIKFISPNGLRAVSFHF